jgi:heme-degrading monooxygenase HmoA
MNDHDLIDQGSVILVNVFTPLSGMTDTFIEAQTTEYVRLKGLVKGARGNRLLRSLDGKHAVNIAYFESVELYDAWIASELFTDHLSRIKHLVEKVEPALFDVAYESA